MSTQTGLCTLEKKPWKGKPQKKSSSLNGRAIKRGGGLKAGPLRGEGVKGRAIKEKKLFWNFFFKRSNVQTAIKLEDLNGPAIEKRTFFCGFQKLFLLFIVTFCFDLFTGNFNDKLYLNSMI